MVYQSNGKKKRKKGQETSEEEIIFAEDQAVWEANDYGEVVKKNSETSRQIVEMEQHDAEDSVDTQVEEKSDVYETISNTRSWEICEGSSAPAESFECYLNKTRQNPVLEIINGNANDASQYNWRKYISEPQRFETFAPRMSKRVVDDRYKETSGEMEESHGTGSEPTLPSEQKCVKTKINPQINNLLMEGSLYGGSSIMSASNQASSFFPEEIVVEEKEENELRNVEIGNMEILHKWQEDIVYEGEEQYQAQQYQQIQLQGHHLVCNYPDTQPKQSIHRMNSFNHVREGSIQNQAMNPTKQTLDNERKKMKEQNRVRSWGDGHEHQSLPMNAIQTNKKHQIGHQTKRNRIRRTKNLQHLSQWQKMEGEESLTKSLPPIWIRNKKSGNENIDLIRHRNNQNKFKFSELSVSMTEKDLQHGMTSGFKNEVNLGKMKCDVTGKMNKSKKRDDEKCPNTYPVVCPNNYFVYLN